MRSRRVPSGFFVSPVIQKVVDFFWEGDIFARLNAGVAQLAEQLICNQQVAGSSPIASSKPETRDQRTGNRSLLFLTSAV
jgi:hypothetical protein